MTSQDDGGQDIQDESTIVDDGEQDIQDQTTIVESIDEKKRQENVIRTLKFRNLFF